MLLRIDPAEFGAGFDRRPFLIGHELAGHRLFDLARLVELARRLPAESVEHAPGDVPISIDPRQAPPPALGVEETIRRIEGCGAWMVLKNVEHDPEYRDLLDRCLDEILPHVDLLEPGMHHRQGFVFLSSPHSVTPYHMDPEHNFLLQLSGRKTVHMFDGRDRTLLSDLELERFHSGGHRNLVFAPEYQDRAWVTELLPGSALHFPVTFPHYVRNGPEVSISFSITFQTPASEQRGIVHKVNAQLRRHGLRPAPLGRAPWRDSAKVLGFETARRLHKLGRRRARRAATRSPAPEAPPASQGGRALPPYGVTP